jgi:hypothetical protein
MTTHEGMQAREAVRNDILRIPASELPSLPLKDRSPRCHHCQRTADDRSVVCCGGVSPVQAATFNARMRLRKLPTCLRVYCFACLATHYGLSGETLLSVGTAAWVCPACWEQCSCVQCGMIAVAANTTTVKLEEPAVPFSDVPLMGGEGEDDEETEQGTPLWLLPVGKPPRKKSKKRDQCPSKPPKAAAATGGGGGAGAGGRASVNSVQDQYRIVAGPPTPENYFPTMGDIDARGFLADIPPVRKLLVIHKVEDSTSSTPPEASPASAAAAAAGHDDGACM